MIAEPTHCAHPCVHCAIEQAVARLNTAQFPTAEPARLLVTVDQAAELLGLSRSTVYDLVRDKTLTARKVGKAVRISYAALQKFADG